MSVKYMAKFLALLKFKFLQSLNFRAEIFVWILLDLIPFGIMFIVFKSIYTSQESYHSYTAHQIILYYLLVPIIQGVSSTHFEGWRVEEIKNGKIDGYLLRPLSYLSEIIVSDIAGKIFYLCIFGPIYVFFFAMVSHYTQFSLSLPNLSQIGEFVLMISFAYVVELSIALLIVLLGFWFEGSQGLEHFKWIVIALLSGSLLPLSFLPDSVQQISNVLPFKYMYFFPIEIIQGKATMQISDYLSILTTICVLFVAVYTVTKKAMYTYSSSGG